MKNIILLTSSAAALVFSSCANMDPEYQAWKKSQKNNPANNPYGAPASSSDMAGVPNGYGVPNNSGITGQAGAPMQDMPPLPGGAGTAGNPLAVEGGMRLDIPHGGTAPAGQAIEHVVVSGDTLWGISKKYSVSVYDIKVTNNITSDTIIVGQKLIIPQN